MPYRVEYAKLGTSKCKGPKPCNGTKIDKGGLRFGTVVTIMGNTTMSWRHWGCVTQKVFDSLRDDAETADDVDGFEDLREEDQARIRKAYEDGHIDPADVPESAVKRDAGDGDGEEVDEHYQESKAFLDANEIKPKPKPRTSTTSKASPSSAKKKAPAKKPAAKGGRSKKKAASSSEEEDEMSDESESEAEMSDSEEDRKPKLKKGAKREREDSPPPKRAPSGRAAAKNRKVIEVDSDSDSSSPKEEPSSEDDVKPKKKLIKKAKKEESDSD